MSRGTGVALERGPQRVAQPGVRLGVVSRRGGPVVEPRRKPPQFGWFGRVAGEDMRVRHMTKRDRTAPDNAEGGIQVRAAHPWRAREESKSMAMIADRVELARRGANDAVICRLPSGGAVIGDVQFLPGCSLLLADPVVASLNDLAVARRAEFPRDLARVEDAILQVTSAERINYESWATPSRSCASTDCCSSSLPARLGGQVLEAIAAMARQAAALRQFHVSSQPRLCWGPKPRPTCGARPRMQACA